MYTTSSVGTNDQNLILCILSHIRKQNAGNFLFNVLIFFLLLSKILFIFKSIIYEKVFKD